MNSAEIKILAALETHPKVCIHVLMEKTGLTRLEMRYALSVLQQLKLIKRQQEASNESVYSLVNPPLAAQTGDIDSASSRVQHLFGLEERVARDRVSMLKRMRERLIEQWHPALNLVISDYEAGLNGIDLLRFGPNDADEFV